MCCCMLCLSLLYTFMSLTVVMVLVLFVIVFTIFDFCNLASISLKFAFELYFSFYMITFP